MRSGAIPRNTWLPLRPAEDDDQKEPKPILDIIDKVIGQSWHGTAAELLEFIRQSYPSVSYKPNTLTREFNPLTLRLERDKGIVYQNKNRSSKHRNIRLYRKAPSDNNGANDDTIPSGEIPSFASLEGRERDG